MGSREGAWAVARPWETEGAQLDGGGADGTVGGGQCRREEGKITRHLLGRLGRDDDSVTAEMRSRYAGLSRRAYGGVPLTDQRSMARTGPVRCGRRRAWPREDSEEPRGAAHGKGAPQSAGGLGRHVGADA
jgi:hypothetical protein